MGSLLSKINSFVSNNARTETAQVEAPVVAPVVIAQPEVVNASNRQRRCVYYSALKFGVKFTGIWEAELTRDQIAPVVKVLHQKSTYSETKKADAIAYLGEKLNVEFEMVDKYTAPSEPVVVEPKVEPKAEAKPKKQRDLTPLEYARFKKSALKAGLDPLTYEEFKANKDKALLTLDAAKAVDAEVEKQTVKASANKVKAKVEAKKVEAVEPKKFDDTEKLAMVMEHLRSQMDMTAALIQALSK